MIPALESTFSKIGGASRIDRTQSIAPAALATPAAGAPDFSTVLSQIAGGAADAVKKAESTGIAGIKGEVSTQAVVDAVMGAERALQTAVVVRDKVVAAYQEITRMAI